MESHLLQAVVSNTIVASALALLATLFGLWSRRPAVAHALWVLVLFKLFTPPLVTLSVGLPFHNAAAHLERSAVVPTQVAPPVENAASSSPSLAEGMVAGSPRGTGMARSAPVPQRAIAWMRPILIGAWLIGSFICAATALFRIKCFSKLLRNASPASHEVRTTTAALSRRLGMRRAPSVYTLPGPICPLVWAPPGTPRIVIPAELWGRLTEPACEGLLLHELAHLKRHDHWVRLLELSATVCFWWHPLVWLARSQLRRAEEQCCDAWVTWASPEGAGDYSAALLEAVDFAAGKAPWLPNHSVEAVLPAIVTGIGQFQKLKRRLIMIGNAQHSPRLGAAGTLVVLVVAFSLPLTTGRRGRASVADIAPATDQRNPQADRRHAALAKGLAWMAANLPDAPGPASPGAAAVQADHETAFVALTGLAFLSSGSDLSHGDYQAQVRACCNAVLADCQDTGLIAPAAHATAPMYDHGYATLFLAEIYASSHDKRIKPRLDRAVALMETSQNTEGGWRYSPKPLDGDVSVTACQLNALLACRAAGIDVNAVTIRNAVRFVIECQNPDGGFSYIRGQSVASGPARSAAAAAALKHAGNLETQIDLAIKYLGKSLTAKSDAVPTHVSYTRYYASQFLATIDGDAPQVTLDAICDDLISLQKPDGSWDAGTSMIAYDTASAVLALDAQDHRLWITGNKR